MRAQFRHSWDLTTREAAALQIELAPQVVKSRYPGPVSRIAGVDISVGGRGGAPAGRGAVIVLDWPSLQPVEQSVVTQSVRFPYVPGLLSFREIPVLLPAFERLALTPDLLVVDGQGYAHPRRM